MIGESGHNGKVGSENLVRFLDEKILPNLTAELLFTHPCHEWQKSGDKWRGCCPWHESRSGTAFYINARTLAWRCPACSDHRGGPIQYLWQLGGGRGSPRGRDLVDTIRKLADIAGVSFPDRELDPRDLEQQRRLETRRGILTATADACRQVLAENAGSVLDWLKTRGLSKEDAEDLGLGLYPDTLRLEVELEKAGYSREEIRESAVLSTNMVGYVTFPWLDDRGRPLTIYGSWPSSKENRPSGKASKMTLPNPKEKGQDWEQTKRSPLYLDRALAGGHQELVLVEGVIDAALLQVRGDSRVVACVGAQLTRLQTETLRRRGIRTVTVCLDPDSAGDDGTSSCVHQLLAAGITPFVALRLPDGKDPDDFVIAEGIETWKAHILEGQHGLRGEARRIINEASEGLKGDRRTQAIKDATAGFLARRISHISGSDIKDYFLAEVAEELGVPVEDLAGGGDPPKVASPVGEYDFRPITSAEFATGDYRPTWHIKRLLVKGQPALVGGPKKVLKTSMLVDMAVSLASGVHFLGYEHFEITKRHKVAILSGESGQYTLQEIAFRVCTFHGLQLPGLDLLWDFRLPSLSDPKQLERFQAGLEREKVEVVAIDPLYLCLLGGSSTVKASDVFGMGPLLASVANACLDVGATPVLSHHTIKRLLDPFKPAELEDLAQAGFAEFARQWLLITRREAFDPEKPGAHKLWLNAGGSVGHGGCWGIDVEEGRLADDFSGRVWDPVIISGGEAIEAIHKNTEEKKQRVKESVILKDCTKILETIDKMDPIGRGVRDAELRTRTGISGTRWGAAIAVLLDQEQIVPIDLERTGNRGTPLVKGWKKP
jgi:hypothetical protein